MYRTSVLPKLAILIALALPAALNGQVPVDISSQKIISGGKAYYMHPVLKGQTLYSISRAYNVTIDDINRVNVIQPNGIQAQQILKIPASQGLAAAQPRAQLQAQPQPAQASPPAKTAEQAAAQPPIQTATKSQSQSQPSTQTATQSQSQTQTQTQTQDQNQPNDQAGAGSGENKPVKAGQDTSHKVRKGESLSSIARDHGVTERELKKANKGLMFPMPGMYLVIPAKQEEGDDSVKKEK